MLEGGKEVVDLVFGQIGLEDFKHPLARGLAETILQRFEDGEPLEPSRLMSELTDPTQRRLIASLVFSKYHLSKQWDDEKVETDRADPRTLAADALAFLRKRALEERIEENQRRLREASRLGEEIRPMLERHQQLLAEMKQLEEKTA